MPGIDFAAVRAAVSILDVLELLDCKPFRRRGDRLRGSCPFGCGGSPRDFAAYPDTDRYYCYFCHRRGNQLELWARLQGLGVYDAAKDLCDRLGIPVPFLYRW
jgi:DNA primase